MSGTGHRRGGRPYANRRRAKALRGRMNPFGYAPNKRAKNRRFGFTFMVNHFRDTPKEHRRYVHRRDWYSNPPEPRVIRCNDMKPLLKNGRKP